jgi:hypothetical protein
MKNIKNFFKKKLHKVGYGCVLEKYIEFCIKYRIPINKVTFTIFKLFY